MKKLAIITSILFTLCLNTFAQESDASITKKVFPNEGKIIGVTSDYEVLGNNLEYLLSFDRPELSVTFDSDYKFDLGSSKGINKILDNHWKEAIKFYHESEIKEFPDATTQTDEFLKWTIYTSKTIKKLRKKTIQSSTKKRKMSEAEATQTINYLNKSALNLIKEAKGKDGKYTNIKIKRKGFAANSTLCKNSSGRARFSVTFDKSGKITNVVFKQRSGCGSFDESTYRATRQIEFEPAKMNDIPITVVKNIQYSFIIN